jgi:hypothetical protein
MLTSGTGGRRRLPQAAAARPGLSSYGPLVQLAVGYRYLWLRNYPSRNPTLRLDRAVLAEAQTISPPKVERAGAE